MLPALCRLLRRLLDPPVPRTNPLDDDEWDRVREGHPVTFDAPILDTRPPHLESDRRVEEECEEAPERPVRPIPLRDPYRWQPGDGL